MQTSPFPAKGKRVSIAELANDTVGGRRKPERKSKAKTVIHTVSKVSMLHKHLSRNIAEYHLEQESSSDDGDGFKIDKNKFMVFCPALESWIRSTQGVSARDAFKAWSKWAKGLAANEKTVGGTNEPKVGMYVIPSHTAPDDLVEDSGGMAGRITEVSQGSDGKLTVAVQWAHNGVEKSGYSIPNKWDFVMALTSDREPPSYPLMIADPEDIDIAFQHETERAWYDTMSDEHLQIFKSGAFRRFDPLSPARKQILVERTGRESPGPPRSPSAAEYASPRARGSPSVSPRRHAAVSPRRRQFSPVPSRKRGSSPYASRGSSPAPRRDGASPVYSKLHSDLHVSEGKTKVRSSLDDHPHVAFVPNTDSVVDTKLNYHWSQAKGGGRGAQSYHMHSSVWHDRPRKNSLTNTDSTSHNDEDELDSEHQDAFTIASSASPSITSKQSPEPKLTSTEARRIREAAAWEQGLKQWRAARLEAQQRKGDDKDEKSPALPMAHSHSFSSSSSATIGDAITTFTGVYGEDWGKEAHVEGVKDQLLDMFYSDVFVPKRPRVYYKEMLPKQRPQSAQHRRAHKELPLPDQLFCRGLSDKEISLLPSAVLLGTTLFRSCVIVCPQDAAPIQRSHKNTTPVPLDQALEEQEITTVCVKDVWEPLVVQRFCRKLARGMKLLADKPRRQSTNYGPKHTHIDPFISVSAWMSRPKTHLACLSLQRVVLRGKGCKLLVDVVLNNEHSKLETVYLLHNELQDEGVQQIVRALTPIVDKETETTTATNQLRSVSMIQNRIRNDGAAAIAQALTGHPTLTHLDLSKNEISSQGGAALAEMVKTNTVLKSLLLVDNQIQAAGSLSFTTALKAAPPESVLTVVTGTAQNPRPSKRPPPEEGGAGSDGLKAEQRSPEFGALPSTFSALPSTFSALPSSPNRGPSVWSAMSAQRASSRGSGTRASEPEQGWRGQAEEGSMLWHLCNGEFKRPTSLSTYGISAHVHEETHKSQREELAEVYIENQKERINSIESLRSKLIGDIVKQFSINSREVMRADQIIKEMKKSRQKLLAEVGQVEKEMRFGWEEKMDTLQAEVEWFTRDIARRESKEGKQEMDPYDKLLSLLFVKDMVIQPGQDLDANPTPEFMERMSLVLKDDPEFQKRQAKLEQKEAPKEPEPTPFPHPHWKKDHYFEVDKCSPTLHVKSKRHMKLLPDGSGRGGWKCAMLSPPILRSSDVRADAASTLPGIGGAGAQGSFVQVRVMNCKDSKRCYAMLGVARGRMSVIASNLFDGKAGTSLPSAVMFALHNGRLYRQGKPAGQLATRGVMERDRVGMWVDPEGRTAVVFHNELEVGSIDLLVHLGPRATSTPLVMSAKAGKMFARSDSALDDPAEDDKALHFIVDLGIDGQEIEIVDQK